MTKSMTAIPLLEDDHRKVEALFEKFENARGILAQAKIVRQICDELTVHMMIEEEIFYPAVSDAVDRDDLEEAVVEHDSARVLIRDLLESGPDEEYYKAKVKVLKEEIEHHVKEEEEPRKGLFAQAKRSKADMDRLGEDLAIRRAELLAKVEDGTLPMPELTTVAMD